MSWNTEQWKQDRFEETSAEQRMDECRQKVKGGSNTHKREHDIALAKCFFHGRFANEARCASPEITKKWLTNFDPAEIARTDTSAFCKEVFERELKRLIAERLVTVEAALQQSI